jgi:hypothetical protein
LGVRVRREGLHRAPPLVDATGASTRRSRHARVDAAAGAMGLWSETPARGAIRAREAQQISPCQKLNVSFAVRPNPKGHPKFV